MNLENENGEITWDIKGFKAFSDLAMTFFPEYSNIDAASKRMRAEIENDESLFNALKHANKLLLRKILPTAIDTVPN